MYNDRFKINLFLGIQRICCFQEIMVSFKVYFVPIFKWQITSYGLNWVPSHPINSNIDL